MKKKLFLTLVISILCLAVFTLVVSAKDVDIQIEDVNGDSIVLPTVDSEGDPLTWYRVTEKPTEGTYFEYVDGSTTYYIVSVKTKVAAYVSDNYRVCYSYSGLTAGAWSGNIMVANLDGLTHADGKGPEYLNFIFEGTPICYVYIPASILELKGTSGNSFKSLFYGCGSLVEVEFEADSKIETLYGNGFYNCKKLTYIKLPENLKTISAAAFVGINPTIVVPKSVTTFEVSNWSNPTVQFTGTASDHAGWAYQPSNISYVEHCVVYHNGQHSTNEDDFDCTTELLCDRCGEILAVAMEHDIKTTITYTSLIEDGTKRIGCANEGCSHGETTVVSALFFYKGYSYTVYDGKYSISQAYGINREAISEYESCGNKVDFGVVFATENTSTNGDLIVDANDANNPGKDKIKVTNLTNTEMKFSRFDAKLVDIAPENQDVGIYVCAYVQLTDSEDNTETYYITNGACNNLAEAKNTNEIVSLIEG